MCIRDRFLDARCGGGAAFLGGLSLAAQLDAAGVELRELGGRLVDGGLGLEEAGRARGAALGEVGAEEVALGGDGGQPGTGHDEGLGVLERVDHHDVAQQRPHCGEQGVGAADEGGGGGR